jgi:hypothetical protein
MRQITHRSWQDVFIKKIVDFFIAFSSFSACTVAELFDSVKSYGVFLPLAVLPGKETKIFNTSHGCWQHRP